MHAVKNSDESDWTVLESKVGVISPWLAIREDRVRSPTGDEHVVWYQDHPGAVAVVALTATGHVLLIRQYRHAVRQWCWELPAGRCHPDRPPLEAAKTELAEEAGVIANSWEEIASFYSTVGSSNERITVFVAHDVTVVGCQPEAMEQLELVPVDWRTAESMASRGMIADGPSALALLLCRDRLGSLARKLRPTRSAPPEQEAPSRP